MSLAQKKTVNSRSWFGRNWFTRPLNHSVVVHGLHKSATMFLFQFFQQVAGDRDVSFYSPNLPGSESAPDDGSIHCFAPCRAFEFTPADYPVQRIFQIRDPRDILVSEYFSFGWIHPNEKGQMLSRRRQEIQEMAIDDYVLQQPQFSKWPLNEKYLPLMDLDFDRPEFNLVRYEDMVLDFPKWVESAITPFEFRSPRSAISRYVKKFASQFEVKAESMTHRRKMTPGDHREKLQPKTIEKLNERFADVLKRFGYSQ